MQLAAWYKRKRGMPTLSWRDPIHRHLTEIACVTIIAIYWLISIKTPLNIGVRHVLPTFPFLYILISHGVMKWIRQRSSITFTNWKEAIKGVMSAIFTIVPRYGVALLLVAWLIIGTLSATPYFLSFYNELAGGTSQGYRIAVDSNYDWGQDLKRLADFMDANNIQHLSLDYFGGGIPQYYLGSRVTQWSSSKGQPKGWFAVSSSFRQGAFGTPIDDFTVNPIDTYEWLRPYEPVARAGYSIFIYKLPEE